MKLTVGLVCFTWWELVVVPDVESVADEPVMEKDVGQAEHAENDNLESMSS